MTGGARGFGVGAVVAAAAGIGCSAECTGPGCQASYQTGRLSWVKGLADGAALDVREDAAGAWTGTAAQGTDWRVGEALGRALVGQPDAARVVAASIREAEAPLTPLSSWVGASGSGFGHDLAAFSGDGAFDLWVSAPDEDFGKGRVYLFRGTDLADRLHDAADAQVTLEGATPNDQLGAALAACGDLAPADGRADLLVGAPLFGQPDREVPWSTPTPALAGAVFLVRSYTIDNRVGASFPWEVGTTWFADQPGAGLGTAMACDRDLDGDAAVDVLLGAPFADDGAGRLYVLDGAALPPDGSLDGAPWVSGGEPGDWFGASVHTFVLGGDPFVAVGAPGADGGVGALYLYRGAELRRRARAEGARRIEPRAVFRSPSGGTGQHFGRTLAVGDLDGDGRDDLVVGTPDAQGPGGNDFDTGAIDVWFGRRTWGEEELAPDARVTGTDPFQRIGRSVLVHDFDGDGVDELLLPTRSRTRER